VPAEGRRRRSPARQPQRGADLRAPGAALVDAVGLALLIGWSEVGPGTLRQIYAVCSPTAPGRPEPRAATVRFISRNALRDQMRIGRGRAGAIVAVVRAEMAAAEVKARQLRAA
jgi:hypothetical protein